MKMIVDFLSWSLKLCGTTYLNLYFEAVDRCSDCRFLLPSGFLNFLRRGIDCLVGGRMKWIGDTYRTILLPKHRHVFPFEIA